MSLIFSLIATIQHLIITVALGLIFALLLYIYFTWTFDKWKNLNVPYVRPIPLFGNYLNNVLCINHPADTYKLIYRKLAGHKYGGFFQMRTPYLMIRDPEMITNILNKDFSYFPNRGIYTDYSTDPMSENLFFLYYPRWKIIRNKISPAFSPGKLKQMLDQIKECSDTMMENIYKKLDDISNEIEVRSILARFSLDVIATCAFGLILNKNYEDQSEFHMYGKTLFQPSPRILIRELCLMISPKLLKILRFPNFPPKASAFFHRIFHETISHREKNNLIRHDIVQNLIQARKELVLNPNLSQDGKFIFQNCMRIQFTCNYIMYLSFLEKFTETQIVANAFVMFAAGFETVSTALSFCLHELSLKKHIQDKVRMEIKTKQSKHNGVLDSEFLKELHYLDMVIAGN
jgi:cytochrome P450 family 6